MHALAHLHNSPAFTEPVQICAAKKDRPFIRSSVRSFLPGIMQARVKCGSPHHNEIYTVASFLDFRMQYYYPVLILRIAVLDKGDIITGYSDFRYLVSIFTKDARDTRNIRHRVTQARKNSRRI